MRISDWSSDVCSSDLDRGAGTNEVDAPLGSALGVVGPPEGAWVGGVVPEVDAGVELELAEVDEAGPLGVGLAVEAQPGREQHERGDGPGFEHHLIAARLQIHRVAAGRGLLDRKSTRLTSSH